MNDALKQERRRSRRVEASLSLNLHLELPSGDARDDLETINVSSTGVYFRSETFIEPMTKLELSLDVQVDDGVAPVNCEGIVARVTPEIPTPDIDVYEVAVFFTTIDAESLHNLEKYIEHRLTN